MGEEQALAAVQCLNLCHVIDRQCKVEQVEVLLHPVFVRGLGNNNHVALHQKAKGGLRGGLAVLPAL